MQTKIYLERDYFDMHSNRYKPSVEVDADAGWIRLKTEHGQILKLFYGLKDAKELTERLEWLRRLGEISVLREMIAFPQALLVGLKQDETGYMYTPFSECDLNAYIHPPEGEKLFKWYCDKTGGIGYRLKIGYMIADSLQCIHSDGLCLMDICPANTLLQPYTPDHPQTPSIQFAGADCIGSYTHPCTSTGHPGYRDPLVALRRSGVSTCSDTYSFAVMLFELLTTCHPFLGDAASGLSPEEAATATDSGALGYIGSDLANQNEIFEDTRILLPEELACLFEQTFTVGKLDASRRPALGEWKDTCLRCIKRIVKCDHPSCGREYPYNNERTCPFCNYPTERIITARVKRVVFSSAELLPPHDGHKNFTPLPPAEEEVNFMVIHAGLNKMTRDFFVPGVRTEYAPVGIFLQYSPSKGKIAIMNCFKKLNVKVCGEILMPYDSTNRGRHSHIVLPDSQEITIELPDNAQIIPEAIVEIKDQ